MPTNTERPRPDGALAVIMHCESNTGYAIEKLERVFFDAAVEAGFRKKDIHFVYPSLRRGKPRWMPSENSAYFEFDFVAYSGGDASAFTRYLRSHGIRSAFVFDLQPSHPVNGVLRKAGVRRTIAYWGATISPLVPWWKLLLKKLELLFRRSAPDFFIFESASMLDLAVRGRGITMARTAIVHTGVDTQQFSPDAAFRGFAHDLFNIAPTRKIFCYSGHMEERKGVHVILKAMEHLVMNLGRRDLHFLALGNTDGEERQFNDLVDRKVFEYVTFGGYRNDLPGVFASSYAGVVASTGWDSWPMSVIEMAASGLPLVVSRLQGLREFVVEGVNGFAVDPGDFIGLAEAFVRLADNPALAAEFGKANCKRVREGYSVGIQRERLATAMSRIFSGSITHPSH
jgi:glycosyltransferase involved in cell wall biosynthesis